MRRVLLGLLLGIACGCGGESGPKVHPVRGQVFVGKEPAEGAFVIFHPVGAEAGAVRPRGWVEADGSFRLTSSRAHDGAVAGPYVVTIEWRPKHPDDDDRELPDRLQGRFADPRTSPLRVRIEEGDNELTPFQLAR